MEDSAGKLIGALAAHLEGLEAALVALGENDSAEVSMRRIARSFAAQAAGMGAEGLAAQAMVIVDAEKAKIAEHTVALLHSMNELRSPNAGDEVHILIIEDNPTVAAAISAYLEGPERVVHRVDSAKDAETLLDEQRIDVVVLDLILPDRDGRDLLVQMRERSVTAAVPVIVLSAQTAAIARAESLALGADEFIEKPAEPKALRAAVRRQLDRAKASEDARRDALTGLPNRGGLAEAFGRLKAETETTGDAFTVAIIDLDFLKHVNDSFGHEAGDRFLTLAVRAIEADLGEGDVLGRWGGDEFVLLRPRADLQSTQSFLESARSNLGAGEGVDPVGPEGSMSFSAGVGPVTGGSGLKEALAEADRALYYAKARGSGQIVTTEDIGSESNHSPAKRVLLVEDDRVTAELIQHRLAKEGFEVTHSSDGDEAFKVALAGRFDLAILDVKIPGMDGFALLEKLRHIPGRREIPVLMLTSMGSEADVVRGLSLGANDYMLKPFSPPELVARIRRLATSRTRR